MRWVVVALFIFNAVFFLKSWLEFDHFRNLAAMNEEARDIVVEDMPGMHLMLLSERNNNVGIVNSGVRHDEVIAPISGIELGHDGSLKNAQKDTVVGEELGFKQFGTNTCVLLGPHVDDSSARRLLHQLSLLQIEAKYADIEIMGEPDYWVYLVPEPTRELATAKLRELQEKKIDSFIIPQGDITNGISLGVFDSSENAERHQKFIIDLGYDAKLRSNPRTYLEKWVVVYPDQEEKLTAALYEQLRSENDRLDLRKERCDKVASMIDIH